ncbi:hypothetical protein RRG08_064314 [Elysia crispata]|uniref:Uncharacterized protein n=1 Tax=Elysia crispata TaxID=231223 RepID=A0AAE1B318_9GAST|nr:hypothetical protein RRG08_064314 [Elysia crispata]
MNPRSCFACVGVGGCMILAREQMGRRVGVGRYDSGLGADDYRCECETVDIREIAEVFEKISVTRSLLSRVEGIPLYERRMYRSRVAITLG